MLLLLNDLLFETSRLEDGSLTTINNLLGEGTRTRERESRSSSPLKITERMSSTLIEGLSKEAHKQAEDLLWVKIVGIGNSGVGKTCLVKTFCENKFTKAYTETVGVDYGFKLHTINDQEVRLTFWDFGGSPAHVDVRKELYHQTRICLLVYDVTNPQSFNALDEWMNEFETFGGKGTLMCVVGNKNDLKNKKVNAVNVDEWANRRRIRHYLTSAATGDGVSKMFNNLLSAVV